MSMYVEIFVKQFWWVFLLIALWTLPWKAVALWKAARRNERGWFVALLLINTMGLLEIFYIFVLTKQANTNNTTTHG
ncbi:MAG: hypothetical protein A3J55_00915 [Candidatus Ryanbacteria bacterium RIFCSPHIGHO2_02_FULL_45_17b]|uniref:DUF5652 domain-containing protein n=1 Tax=Candidatus Ryanbacteria bacterium RIFCSPHIGHO2_01_FULL_45_22 TaxID=1802114 RepID=A0A1G2G185_9BACT|nr:MAG: hypothetical protein A2719_03380 [Candidatus Ryanbacteria bacterium RIFCSPHIGHO2_01_FULL_45_22]OGZ47206.1 MAG: hypothetical protein A3J55_00915 [Candidatus Ryanbacteria bacterium RIFCSPHIGHO2_02_FULL_45_17b]